MELTLHGVSKKHDGFGTTSKQIEKTLKSLNYSIVPESPVTLSFSHPHTGKLTDGYDIIYFPWESTEPLPGWKKILPVYDEIWVTSPWVQQIVADWGFESLVYEHGVNLEWQPTYRQAGNKFIFLMQGFEALRKGSWEALRAFLKNFRGNDEVFLYVKTNSRGMANVSLSDNIVFITEDLNLEQLIDLYSKCHVMLAPTYGEGFGIPSRDAMATGMPLIHTQGFAPYENFMHEELIIPSRLVDSPWPKVHPGKMYQPDVDALAGIMKNVYENYEFFSDDAYQKASKIHEYYNWKTLTENVFTPLQDRV
jgi:glycosyltransferase involved in cell wall biosynthesis